MANLSTVMRYFLHICRTGDVIHDPDGGEHASLDEAKSAAVEGLRELLAAAIALGHRSIRLE